MRKRWSLFFTPLGQVSPTEAESFFELPERVIRIGTPPFRIERFQTEDRFIHLGTQPPQLEVMTSISGVEFAQCYPKRVTDDLDGVLVNFIGGVCLRDDKRASIRPKDADDYAHLLQGQVQPAQLKDAT